MGGALSSADGLRPTERRRPGSAGLDELGTRELVDLLADAHSDVPRVVAAAAAETAAAVELVVERLSAGGRLAYAGGGTSGLLAAADAAELPPTFGIPDERIAVARTGPAPGGGRYDEDEPGDGAAAVAVIGLEEADVAVALASSGSTPFTLGAVDEARSRGAAIVAVVNVPGGPVAEGADVAVVLDTGPEPIMGSTRLRAGLAQRLWLSVFSTAVMVRLGLTHDDLMVNVAPALAKLRERRVTIAAEATGRDPAAAAELLEEAGDDLRAAIVMGLTGADRGDARAALDRSGGRTRAAIAALGAR